MAIGPTRFGLRAATARRIRSAIRRSELERSGLGTCRALAGCRSERPLSRGEPWDGLAARPFSRTYGKEHARPLCGAWAAGRRPFPGNAGRDASFALLVALVEWQRQIQIGASILVIAFGIFRLVNPRHPRALARIPPTQLGVWSFAVAIAHGAGFMLVPIYLGLCRVADLDSGHEAASALINGNMATAVLVSLVHGAAMIAAGGLLAWSVYRHLGLKFVSRSWFNLDATWALSLALVGAVSLAFSVAGQH